MARLLMSYANGPKIVGPALELGLARRRERLHRTPGRDSRPGAMGFEGPERPLAGRKSGYTMSRRSERQERQRPRCLLHPQRRYHRSNSVVCDTGYGGRLLVHTLAV